MQDAENTLTSLQQQLSEANGKDNSEQIQGIQNEIQNLELELNNYNSKIESINSEVATLQSSLSKTQSDLDIAKSKVEEAKSNYDKKVEEQYKAQEKMDEMEEQVRAATMRYHELGDSIKAAEARMAEIAVMKTHIINYAKTRPIYEAYRKAGYSKRFLEANRESIALHKAAKAAFDEAGLKKLPKVKELSIEYVELLKKKKAEYPSYRKARERMQELMKAQKNVEMFFADNRSEQEQQQTR